MAIPLPDGTYLSRTGLTSAGRGLQPRPATKNYIHDRDQAMSEPLSPMLCNFHVESGLPY